MILFIQLQSCTYKFDVTHTVHLTNPLVFCQHLKQKQSQKHYLKPVLHQKYLETNKKERISSRYKPLKHQISIILMRCTIYILTFFTYATIHMMRMTYSFNKHSIETTFKISDLVLGLLDSLMFIALSVGTFLRYELMTDKRLALVCLKTSIVVALAYAVLPMVAMIKGQQLENHAHSSTYFILFITWTVFGFFQFSFFPSLITIFSHHFNVKSDGSLVGIWSSKSNVGNIMGFFLSNFMVYQMGLRWELTMICCSIIHLTVGILLQRLVVQIDNDSQKKITTAQLFKFLKQKWSQPQFRLYILSFSFFKAILYSYELWTPQFLVDVGFKQYSGYVPMVFDISTLLGSYVMGRLYENQAEEHQKQKNLIAKIISYKFTIASVMILVAALLYLIVQPNIYLYFGLGVFMGMFLGGVYNSLENSQILSYAKNNPRQTDLLSTINIGLGCALVGVMQLVVGLVIYFGSSTQGHGLKNRFNQKHQHRLIYLVIAVLAVIAMGLTWARTHFIRKQQKTTINEQSYFKQINSLQSDE